MRKQFTFEDFKAHPDWKVETNDGTPVEIIHVENDCQDELPIIAMIGQKPLRRVKCYTIDGYPETEEDDLSLFLVTPEAELTEFERTLGFAMGFSLDDMENNRNEAIKHIKEVAAELIEITRKELNKQFVFIPVDEYMSCPSCRPRKAPKSPLLQRLFSNGNFTDT